MSRCSLLIAYCSALAFCALGSVRGEDDGGGAGVGVDVDPRIPPIEDLICFCSGNVSPEVAFLWRDPRDFAFEGVVIFIVRRDGTLQQLPIPPIQPGVEQARFSEAPLDEEITFALAVRVRDEISVPVTCTVRCPQPPEQVPIAAIGGETPQRVVQLPGEFVEFTADGRASVDAVGVRRLEFVWSIDSTLDGLVELLEPRSVVCRVRVRALPANLERLLFSLRLRVVSKGTIERAEAFDDTQFEVLVVRAGGAADPREPIAPLPVPEIHRVVLANAPDAFADADRLHRVDFRIALVSGNPHPRFRLLEGPEGLTVDPRSGQVVWAPTVSQAGRIHRVAVLLQSPVDPAESVDLTFPIAVVDAATPPALYALGRGLGRAIDPGGGAGGVDEEFPAPAFVADRSAVPLALDLHLDIPLRNDACAVATVLRAPGPDGVDAVPLVRFEPACTGGVGLAGGGADAEGGGADAEGGGAGPVPPLSGPSGGYYTSGSAASGVAQAMIESDELTLEVWVSGVADFQPGAVFGAPAYIFSQSKGTGLFNWRLGVDDEPGATQRYFADVTTDAGVVRLEGVADLSDSGDHQIIVVRRHETPGGPATHRLFIDGVELDSEASAGSLSSFDKTFQIFVGAAQGGANPLTGSVSTCGTYAEGLSDGMIAFLHGLGPSDPEPGEVGDPTAAICPDPHEIIRTRWGADGGESTDGIGGGGGGGGGFAVRGGGAGGACADFLDFLYPCEWSVLPDAGIAITPSAGYEACWTKVEIDFPWPESPLAGGNRRYEVTLRVRQIAVRGSPTRESAPVARTVVLADGFRRGDTNDDGLVDVSDPVRLLLWMFAGLPDPPCRKAADFDDDEQLEIADAQLSLMYLFQGGPPPPSPGPTSCGYDSGASAGVWLSCLRSDSCP